MFFGLLVAIDKFINVFNYGVFLVFWFKSRLQNWFQIEKLKGQFSGNQGSLFYKKQTMCRLLSFMKKIG
jgi:hypothetical protein